MALELLGTTATAVRNNTSGTTISATHTLIAGSNRIAIVVAAIEDDAAIASCTYGGVSMTAMTEKAHSTGGTATRLRMFYLLEAGLPADGSKTVTMTSTNAFLSGVIHVFTIHSAKQQSPEASNSGEASNTTTVSEVVTTITDGAIIISAGAVNNNTSATHGTGQTEIADTPSGASNTVTLASSYEIKETQGADTQSHVFGSSQELVSFGMAFAPAPSGSGAWRAFASGL